jgi:hypothetical protein
MNWSYEDEGASLEDYFAAEGVPLKDPGSIRFGAAVEQAVHERLVQRAAEVQLRPPPKELDIETLGITAAQLLKDGVPPVDWLVPNLMGRDWMCKLSGREKSGKSVLAFVGVIGPLERGEATVFGDATERATTLIYTEEPADAIIEKLADAGLRGAGVIYAHELGGHSWKEKVKVLVAVASARGHKLIFIDNFSRAAEVEDENGPEMGRAAEYLAERAKAAQLAVLVLHHHRKAGGNVFDLSRGGTALAAACDVNIALQEVGTPEDRRRKLTSRGRLKATNWVKTVLLNDAGTAYSLIDTPLAPDIEAQEYAYDRMRLHGMGQATAKEFAENTSFTDRTAARKLKRMADDHYAKAVVTPGKATVWHWNDVLDSST